MNNKYILIEDDAAPDSKESFELELIKITGYSISDFKCGVRIEDGWIYNGLKLEHFPDAPQYHLSLLSSLMVAAKISTEEKFSEFMEQIEVRKGDIKDKMIIALEEQIGLMKKWAWFMLGLGIILGIITGLILYPVIISS